MRIRILKVLSLLLTFAILETPQGKGFAMEKKDASSPYGVVYFSNGVTIEKIDLKTRNLEIVIPEKDENGERFHSTYPVYASKRNKMYFIQMLWPKCHVAIYDFKSKKIESRIDVCPNSLSLSLSPNEQWLTYFRGGKPALLKDEEMKPSQLLIKNILNGDEKIIAKDASPFGLPAIWLADDELIYKNISDGTVLININTQKKQIWNLKKGISPNALSPDGKHLLCDDYLAGGKNVYLLDLKDQSLKPVMHSWFFLIQSADFLSPDGKSFIYTRQSWEDLIPLHEVGNIYWRDLSTGKEQKLSDNVALFGGFWLAEDPMNKPEFENKK